VIAKEGAEGLVCATSLPQAIGIAMKVTDGNWRRLAPAFIEVLRTLDVLTPEALDRLAHHERLAVLGGEEPQGTVEAVVRLRRPR
jgi:L-asparaginase II